MRRVVGLPGFSKGSGDDTTPDSKESLPPKPMQQELSREIERQYWALRRRLPTGSNPRHTILKPEPKYVDPRERKFSPNLNESSWWFTPEWGKQWILPNNGPEIPHRRITQDVQKLDKVEADTKHAEYQAAVYEATLSNRKYTMMNVPVKFDAYETFPGARYKPEPLDPPTTISNGKTRAGAQTAENKGFLSLPSELRLEIYSYIIPEAFDQNNPLCLAFDRTERKFMFSPRSRASSVFPAARIVFGEAELPGYLLVCKRITYDILDFIYGWRGGFNLENHPYLFLNTIGIFNARKIRKLTLNWDEVVSTNRREGLRCLMNLISQLPNTEVIIRMNSYDSGACDECIRGIFRMNKLDGRCHVSYPSLYDYNTIFKTHVRYCDGRCRDEQTLVPEVDSEIPSMFLNLPLGIRKRIYHYILVSADSSATTQRMGSTLDRTSSLSSAVTIKKYEFGYRSFDSSNAFSALLFTCKQMHNECHDIIYSTTTFHIPARSLSWFDHLSHDRLCLLRRMILSYDCDLPKQSGLDEAAEASYERNISYHYLRYPYKRPISRTSDVSKLTRRSLRHMNAKIWMLANVMSYEIQNGGGALESVEVWVQRFSVPFLYYLRNAILRLIAVAKAKKFMARKFGDTFVDGCGRVGLKGENYEPLEVKVIAYDYIHDHEVYWTEDIGWMVKEEKAYAWDCDTRSWALWKDVRGKAEYSKRLTALDYEKMCRNVQ